LVYFGTGDLKQKTIDILNQNHKKEKCRCSAAFNQEFKYLQQECISKTFDNL